MSEAAKETKPPTKEQLVKLLQASKVKEFNQLRPPGSIDLSEADLAEANLTRANLTRANLSGTYLTGANLTKANLTRADLFETDLTEANLFAADLTRANLTQADLTRANLTQADLTRADLTEANLAATLGLNLHSVTIDLTAARTLLPPHFDKNTALVIIQAAAAAVNQ